MTGLFFIYSLKVALCLAVFYLVYKLLLSRDTFHAFNRVVLLAIVLSSLIIPWVKMTTSEPTPMAQGMVAIGDYIDAGIVADEDMARPRLSWALMAFFIYLIGMAFFALYTCYNYVRLWMILRGSNCQERNGLRILIMPGETAPFSWFRNIVISERDYAENRREILLHEQAHVRLHHSWDVLLCDVLIIFQWFNPAAWLLKRELTGIHEYEADEAVLQEGVDAKQYQLLLIRKSVGERLFSMANNFNYSSLKKRIAMMTMKRSSRWQRAKVLAVVPVAAVAVVAFANPRVENAAQQIEAESSQPISSLLPEPPARQTDHAVIVADSEMSESARQVQAAQTAADTALIVGEKTYDVVEQMPEFPGGVTAMMEWVQDNLKYPAAAVENNVQGRVVVTFIVWKDGTVTNPVVAKSVEPTLDAEALRVISAMPKWIPGKQNGQLVNVKYTVPVTFKLKGDSPETASQADRGESPKPVTVKTDNVTFVIDGVKQGDNNAFSNLNPKDIESIMVLKDKASIEKYGDKGKEGVILITTKTKKSK